MLLIAKIEMGSVEKRLSYANKIVKDVLFLEDHKSLLRDLMASGLDTQFDDKIDLLDKISDEAQRGRLKIARSDLTEQVQSLFDKSLDERKVPCWFLGH